MPREDRIAAILATLAWLAHLGQGNIVVERWRTGLREELRAIDAGKERAA